MRNAMTKGANTILQFHVMSLLILRKKRTAANDIKVVKNTSNADINELTSQRLLYEGVSVSWMVL
jgi:hypothetical protein